MTMAQKWSQGEGTTPGAKTPGADAERELALLQGLQRGDAGAFERVFLEYRSDVYNLSLRVVRNAEEAKDVTQEVFLKVFAREPARSEPRGLRPWLYRVTLNTCYDHLRRDRRRPRVVSDDLDVCRATGDPFGQAETAAMIEASLGSLNHRQRMALVLKDLHGLRYDEIGEVLAVRPGTAQALLFRARKAFRVAFVQMQNGVAPAGCDVARRAVLECAGGELPDGLRRDLERHARTCSACRRELQPAAAGCSVLALFVVPVAVPPALLAVPTVGVPGDLSLGHAYPSFPAGPVAVGAAGVAGKLGGALSAKLAIGLAALLGTGAGGAAIHHGGSQHQGSVKPSAAAAVVADPTVPATVEGAGARRAQLAAREARRQRAERLAAAREERETSVAADGREERLDAATNAREEAADVAADAYEERTDQAADAAGDALDSAEEAQDAVADPADTDADAPDPPNDEL